MEHRTPYGHPERRQRVEAVVSAVRGSDHVLQEVEASRVPRELLELVHDSDYIDQVHAFCVSGGGALDEDTFAVPASWDAAIHAAGAGLDVVERLSRRSDATGFVAVRPPGHHAEANKAMGFCLFNNIAITAAALLAKGERVAVVDWDVHHGNGTQHSFLDEPNLLYLSLHEFPFYPGTGWVDEVGEGVAAGTTVNIPLPNGTQAESYLASFHRIAMPVLRQYAPDWILISNGYDAHANDPLGGLRLESAHYGWMASALTTVVPANRMIAFLEGGYDLDALGSGAVATLDGMTGRVRDIDWPTEIEGSAARLASLTIESVSRHWEVV